MAIRNSVLANLPGTTSPLVHLRNGKPDRYRDFLENKLELKDVVFWSPETPAFGIGFKTNEMVEIDQFSTLTGASSIIWKMPGWRDPDAYDYAIESSSLDVIDTSRLPKVTLSSQQRDAIAAFAEFMPVQGDKDKGFEVAE